MAKNTKYKRAVVNIPAEQKKQLQLMAIEIETSMENIIRACMDECMPEGPEYIKDLIETHKINNQKGANQ